MPKTEETRLRKGDTIKCADAEHDADLDAAFGEVDGIIAWQPLPEPMRKE